MKSLSRAVLCINARGAKKRKHRHERESPKDANDGKTERTNLGEDGNDGTNVGVWMRSEVQNMKQKGTNKFGRRRKRWEKKWRRLHERGSPRTEKMKMEKMEKMRRRNGRGTSELQNVGEK